MVTIWTASLSLMRGDGITSGGGATACVAHKAKEAVTPPLIPLCAG